MCWRDIILDRVTIICCSPGGWLLLFAQMREKVLRKFGTSLALSKNRIWTAVGYGPPARHRGPLIRQKGEVRHLHVTVFSLCHDRRDPKSFLLLVAL